MSNQPIIYNFGDTDIEAVETNNGIVLSDEQIGVALGYAEPGVAIRNVIARNADELHGLATSIKLSRVENGRDVTRSIRVWNEQGVMAITFLARTKTAAAFRKWARETLFAMRQGEGTQQNPQEIAALVQVVTQLSQVVGSLVQGQDVMTRALTSLADRVDRLEGKQAETPKPFIKQPAYRLAAEILQEEQFKSLPVLGSPIKEFRRKLGLSRSDFARQMDLGLKTIKNAERGNTRKLQAKFWESGFTRLGYDYQSIATLYKEWREGYFTGQKVVSFPAASSRQ